MIFKIKDTYSKIIVLIFCVHFSTTSIYADNRDPLWETQYEFNKKEYNLKGPVYSVSIKTLKPIIKLGEVVKTVTNTTDSLIFDEKGNIYKRFKKGAEITYSIEPDTVKYSILTQSGLPSVMSVTYKRDLSNNITEVRRYNNDNLYSRRVFQYTPTGFRSIYYHDEKEETYVKNGNSFKKSDDLRSTSGKFNKEGQVISMKIDAILVESSTYYTYNQHGDIIRINDNAKLTNTIIQNDVGIRLEYVYDDHGNWIEKHRYKNGKLEDVYEKRDIIYKTPEEIINERKKENERIRLFEDELRKKGEELANAFMEKKRQFIKECLIASADNQTSASTPIANFSVTDDCYSFDLSNGEHIDGVRFEILDKRSYTNEGFEDLISQDLRSVLVPKYDTREGPKWYIVRYNELVDFDFNPTDSIDWVQLYRDKYSIRNNVSDKDIQELYLDELNSQWKKSKYYSFDNYIYHNAHKLVCVNELVDAYDKGFISPSASNKRREADSLRAYKAYKEDEKRKYLCRIANSAADFYHDKPVGNKLKKISSDQSGYYFKKKDNSEIINPIFDTSSSGGSTNWVFLSSDQSIAMVYKFTYDGSYVFIIELDGDNVKTVNYFPLKGNNRFIGLDRR